ncbi:cupin [Pseudomonas alcaligenes]|uniref:Cupin n=1 Tax=Aquipseudomonas alcaligenes TaxID=43263 RepID=A0ABR7RVN4_AQUAC|nr:cupin domain-containing protein [Pseudomonas alcaligenes]MBC9249350.1 cupin [Pseudomonas alcaligenes]
MSKLPAHVVDFASNPVEVQINDITDPAIVEAPYRSHTWRHFSNPQKQFTAGIWEAGPHKEYCSCDFDELCHLIEGRVRLTDADGSSREFGPGSSFVVAAGFRGTWENLTPVRKVYVILGA